MEKQNNIKHIDWKALKRAIIVLFIVFIISIIISSGSYFYVNYMQQQEETQNKILQNINERYEKVIRSQKVVDSNYFKDFHILQEKAFIQTQFSGELDIAALQRTEEFKQLLNNISKDLYISIIGLQFFEPKLLTNLPILGLVKDLKFYKTSVVLTLGIYHEEDMLQLLERIAQHPQAGILNIEYCQISQLHDFDINDVTQPYFKSSCEISWYTVGVKTEL